MGTSLCCACAKCFIQHDLQFFERMELFAEESVRKQEELTERIKREVITNYLAMTS